MSRRRPLSTKSRASDLSWQKKEYETNMKVKRGELVWDITADGGKGAYIEPKNEDN